MECCRRPSQRQSTRFHGRHFPERSSSKIPIRSCEAVRTSASRAPHASHRTTVRGLPPLRHATRRVNRQRACVGEPVRIAGGTRRPGSKAGRAPSAARRRAFDRCRSLALRAGVPPQLAPIRIRQFIEASSRSCRVLKPESSRDRHVTAEPSPNEPSRPSCPAAPDTSAGFRRSCRARCSPPRLRSLPPRPPPSPRSRRTGPSTTAPSRPSPSP